MRLNLKPMSFQSNNPWKVVKYTWLIVGFSLLPLGLGTFLVESSGLHALAEVLPFMILLSFPSGFVFFLLAYPFIDIYPPVDFSLLWFGTFVLGYFQWFQIVPDLGKSDIISLSLSAPLVAEKNESLSKIVLPKKTKLKPGSSHSTF